MSLTTVVWLIASGLQGPAGVHRHRVGGRLGWAAAAASGGPVQSAPTPGLTRPPQLQHEAARQPLVWHRQGQVVPGCLPGRPPPPPPSPTSPSGRRSGRQAGRAGEGRRGAAPGGPSRRRAAGGDEVCVCVITNICCFKIILMLC